MQKLINDWKEAAKIARKASKDYIQGASFALTADILLQCAEELSKVNTFKFCVGDTVIFGARRLIIISRHEGLIGNKIKRSYICSDTLPYDESELSPSGGH